MTSTSLVCHVCGAEPRKGARFCDACGERFRAKASEADFEGCLAQDEAMS